MRIVLRIKISANPRVQGQIIMAFALEILAKLKQLMMALQISEEFWCFPHGKNTIPIVLF